MTVTGTFNFEQFGDGDPMLLLHGLAGSLEWWSRNVEGLSQQFHVYCLDFSGFGGSRKLTVFDLERITESLIQWMDEQHIDCAVLIGHSMGGMIAARLAAEAPARVRKLVLVDAAFLAFDPGLRRRIRGLLRAAWTIPRDFYPVFVKDALRADPRSIVGATYSLLRVDWRPMLSEIKSPTLVIWGESDSVTPLKIAEGIVGSIPASKFVLLEHAGHNPMWDQADRFNEEILRFVSE